MCAYTTHMYNIYNKICIILMGIPRIVLPISKDNKNTLNSPYKMLINVIKRINKQINKYCDFGVHFNRTIFHYIRETSPVKY